MPSPTISHLICTTALVSLILIMPFYYSIVLDNISMDVARRELKEIADYVSNTFANLYFLVNSTQHININLTKELIYLPFTVEDSIYVIKISGSGGNATKVSAYLRERSSIISEAWLAPGLKIGSSDSVESWKKNIVAGCTRNGTGIYIWLGSE